MTSRVSNCPNCGAAAHFRWSGAVQTVCEYCRSILVRRDLDLERVREMIERGGLSGREAEFYREAPAGPQNETASPPE